MQRYFVDPLTIKENICQITNSDLHHIRDVLRYTPGQEVIISIIGGQTYRGIIQSIAKDKALIDLKEVLYSDKPKYNLSIAQALIKKDRFELFLEKATEFGATAIIPTIFARSIIKIDNEKENNKLHRYVSIVKEAAEQSQRFDLPLIQPFVKLKTIDYQLYDKIIVCYEQEAINNHIKQVISSLHQTDKILIVIGPERRITSEEIEFLKSKQAIFVSLGRQILRSESAAIMILAAFMYEWEV